MGTDVEVIDADDDGEALEGVAAIDVAKASGTVCVRIPGRTRRITRVWDVKATTGAIMALADELAELRVKRAVVKSTSDYWRPYFYLFEAKGITVWLVNARDVKNVPGRPKTDKLDAIWLAKLNERGMLRPSFVPPREIRELRDYTRLRAELVEERSRHRQRLEKLLEDSLIKLSTVATDLLGKSGRSMLEALIAGQRDPEVLADLALSKMRKKTAALREALTGRFDAHHAELARMLLDEIDGLGDKIDRLTVRVDELVGAIERQSCTGTEGAGDRPGGAEGSDTLSARPPGPSVLERLDEVPGIGLRAAQVIVAEVGLDMAQFPTAAHLVSWAKLSPRTIQSGPRTRSGRTGKGNPYLKGVLGEVASAAARTDTCRVSCVGAADSAPSSPSPARSSSSSGTSSTIPLPASSTSARTSTTVDSTRIAEPATSSASSWHWVTRSPSIPRHESGLRPERGSAPHPWSCAPTSAHYSRDDFPDRRSVAAGGCGRGEQGRSLLVPAHHHCEERSEAGEHRAGATPAPTCPRAGEMACARSPRRCQLLRSARQSRCRRTVPDSGDARLATRAPAQQPATRLNWERVGRLASPWLPLSRVVHPFPDVGFTART